MPPTWLPVPEYEGFYSVSNSGRVRGETREVRHGANMMTVRGRELRPNTDRKGYEYVILRRAGGSRCQKVHVLVARAFLGNRPEGMVIRHLDGNPLNNSVHNLRYGTPSENNLDAVQHGTHGQARKNACPRGHPLVDGNLVASAARLGNRDCLACARARAYLQVHQLPAESLPAVASRYLQEIVNRMEIPKMRSVQEFESLTGARVLDYLDRQADVPVITKIGCQGDVIVYQAEGRQATTMVPSVGVAVVRGESGGNTHSLHGDGPVFWDAHPRDLTLGTLTVPDGSTAILAHPEHGFLAIAPGTFIIGRQREQADVIRLVAD